MMGLVNSLAYNIVATKQVKDLTDLKNRRIGVSRIGSSSHAPIAIGLDHFKLDAKRDNITYVQSGTMTNRIAGMRAGSINRCHPVLLEPASFAASAPLPNGIFISSRFISSLNPDF